MVGESTEPGAVRADTGPELSQNGGSSAPSSSSSGQAAPPPSELSLRWVAERGLDVARSAVDAVDLERQVDRLPGASWVKDQLREKLPDIGPGAARVKEQLQSLERDVIRVLRGHFDSVDPRVPETKDAMIPPVRTASPAAAPAVPDLEEPPEPVDLLSRLLERGVTQTSDEARREVLLRAVRDLVPDEAKILASMVDGRTHPVLNIDAASPLGTQRVLSYVTNGRLAGVRSSSLLLRYVTHLVELGLVEVGPEDPAFDVDYQVLEASSEVRATVDRIEHRRLHKGRTERATLHLSELGQAMWDTESARSDQS